MSTSDSGLQLQQLLQQLLQDVAGARQETAALRERVVDLEDEVAAQRQQIAELTSEKTTRAWSAQPLTPLRVDQPRDDGTDGAELAASEDGPLVAGDGSASDPAAQEQKTLEAIGVAVAEELRRSKDAESLLHDQQHQNHPAPRHHDAALHLDDPAYLRRFWAQSLDYSDSEIADMVVRRKALRTQLKAVADAHYARGAPHVGGWLDGWFQCDAELWAKLKEWRQLCVITHASELLQWSRVFEATNGRSFSMHDIPPSGAPLGNGNGGGNAEEIHEEVLRTCPGFSSVQRVFSLWRRDTKWLMCNEQANNEDSPPRLIQPPRRTGGDSELEASGALFTSTTLAGGGAVAGANGSDDSDDEAW